ncbi:MAG: hypothetical protein JSS81_18260 [Acidobacteria bacterium]|nr:hypothetical protein [Acidobacteriota bacterium]
MFLFCGGLLLLIEALNIRHRTEETLGKERRFQAIENLVSFSRVDLTPHLDKNLRILQNSQNVSDLVSFQNSVFAASDGGLVELSENGDLKRFYTVLDGLPESDLTALAVFQSRLFIGTRSKGLVDYDGRGFSAFRLENHETQTVTALFVDREKLLIGTAAGGLLEYDGRRLLEIKAGDERIESPISIFADGQNLYIGTFASGLYVRQNQIWRHFTTAGGLLSNRVVGVGILGDTVFAASDMGVSRAPAADLSGETGSPFSTVAAIPELSGSILFRDRLYLTREDGEILLTDEKNLKRISDPLAPKMRGARLRRLDGRLLLIGSRGIFEETFPAKDQLTLSRFGPAPDDQRPADNNVSALAVDGNNRLWIGTFRGGVDVFSNDLKKLKHLETEQLREINSFQPNPARKGLLAATTGGVYLLGDDLSYAEFLSKTELPGAAVAALAELDAPDEKLLIVAASKGLLLKDRNSLHVLSTINGLPGNTVTSVLVDGKTVYAGTMSGLAQIEGRRVVRVFKSSNSGLGNNWVTALCRTGGRLFAGTYGGGVYELLPSGEIRSFETETGKFSVNPNALFGDGRRLFAGTLDGVRILDLETQKWRKAVEFLPSENVMAVTGDDRRVLFGTTAGLVIVDQNYWTEKDL